MPKLPTLNLSKVVKLSDADDIVEPERSHGIKQFGGPKSARSLATFTQAKFKSAVSSISQMSPRISTASKGLTPRFSIAAMLTPRTRGNLDEAVRSATAESAFDLHGTLGSGAGPLEAASYGAPIGMSSAQMEGELLLARTDLMATKKVRTLHSLTLHSGPMAP